MSTAVDRPAPPIHYPDSDGQPMSDNTLQYQWIVTIQGGELLSRPLIAGSGQPQPDVFRLPESAMIDAPELFEALTSLGTVARFRTPELWEAIQPPVG